MTLTYNDDALKKASGNDIRKFINRLKQTLRNRKKYWEKKQKQGLVSRYQFLLKQFKYAWKVEHGKKNNRPHFHLIIQSSIYYSKKKVEQMWKCGFVSMKKIFNSKHSKSYVYKYMSKELKYDNRFKRLFSTSRNIKKPIDKEWKYAGVKDGVNLVLWYLNTLDIYPLDKRQFLRFNLILAIELNEYIESKFIGRHELKVFQAMIIDTFIYLKFVYRDIVLKFN